MEALSLYIHVTMKTQTLSESNNINSNKKIIETDGTVTANLLSMKSTCMHTCTSFSCSSTHTRHIHVYQLQYW